MKKVTVNGTVVSHERYLYRGYLQIAALDMLNSRNVIRTTQKTAGGSTAIPSLNRVDGICMPSSATALKIRLMLWG